MKNHLNYPDQSTCAHAWANQLSTDRYSSNLFFDGNIIFSYGRHFPISILDANRVFVTTRYYSRSTAKQKSRVLAAVSHRIIIYVPFLPNHFEQQNDFFINQNVDIWIERLENAFLQFASNKGKTQAVRTVQSILSELDIFLRELSLKPSLELRKILKSPTLLQINAHYQQVQSKSIVREANRVAKQTVSFAKKLSDWRKGFVNLMSSSDPQDSRLAYLRFNTIHNFIETSKGIKVPIDVANRFYSYIIKVLASNNFDVDYNILNFKVSSISLDFIIIGCHTIPISEIRSIALRLNW